MFHGHGYSALRWTPTPALEFRKKTLTKRFAANRISVSQSFWTITSVIV
jgi:hypothetical protein